MVFTTHTIRIWYFTQNTYLSIVDTCQIEFLRAYHCYAIAAYDTERRKHADVQTN